MNNKIVFINFLNDYSGSPSVLKLVVEGLFDDYDDITILTSKTEGFLSDIIDKRVKFRYIVFDWKKNKISTLFLSLLTQIQLFFMIMIMKRQNTTYYINTIVPIGAVLSCLITRKEMVYHVHENMNLNKKLYQFYRLVFKIANKKTIFVSNYLKYISPSVSNSIVAENPVSRKIFVNSKNDKYNLNKNVNILLVSSYRKHKGIYEFIELSKKLPKYKFELVLNTDENSVSQFVNENKLGDNITVYSKSTELHQYYSKARIFLHLSHPDTCIESFGLTILEAITYGIPVIAPEVGGPSELVIDGYNGYNISSFDEDRLIKAINRLMKNNSLCIEMSNNAKIKSLDYSYEIFINQIKQFIR